ncbi:hypothetical protein JCM19233_1952 [Vibrio astriarenae]|nr:hypothetical protein JCM19233_1952 [Vibrio sp. C7]
MALINNRTTKYVFDLTGPQGNTMAIASFIEKNSDYKRDELLQLSYEDICAIFIHHFSEVIDIIHDFGEDQLQQISQKIKENTEKQQTLRHLLSLI